MRRSELRKLDYSRRAVRKLHEDDHSESEIEVDPFIQSFNCTDYTLIAAYVAHFALIPRFSAFTRSLTTAQTRAPSSHLGDYLLTARRIHKITSVGVCPVK